MLNQAKDVTKLLSLTFIGHHVSGGRGGSESDTVASWHSISQSISLFEFATSIHHDLGETVRLDNSLLICVL